MVFNTVKRCGSILQEELLSSELSIYNGTIKNLSPKTVIIPNTDFIRRHGEVNLLNKSSDYLLVNKGEGSYRWAYITKDGLVSTDYFHYDADKPEHSFGLEIPTSITHYYGLKKGDFVEFVIDEGRGLVYISSVNLESDIDRIQHRPRNLSKFRSDYPREPLPIEKNGNFDLRVMTLLSPIGLGSSHWIVAPGGSGKTWLLREIFDSCLTLTYEMKNLFIIMGCVGDRPEDEAVYIGTLEKRRRARAEIHASPWNTHPDHQIEVTKFAKFRANTLAAEGWDVVFIFDSLTRAVAIHSSSSYADKK
ncbi:hypothetical protein K0B04_04030, partial [Patescibacteria group bacterium]|nr:hypothetical protein [Patescibacteria group bacterium]